MQGFQENVVKLAAGDTQVLGVSMDSPFANKAFADQNSLPPKYRKALGRYGGINPSLWKSVRPACVF